MEYEQPDVSMQVSEEKTAELSEDTRTEHHTSIPTSTVTESGSCAPGSDALSQSEGLPEGPAQSNPDPDLFSESYTHVAPSSDEPPAMLLSTETLGRLEPAQEEPSLAQEGTRHELSGEGLQGEGGQSDLFERTSDAGKQAGMNNKT